MKNKLEKIAQLQEKIVNLNDQYAAIQKEVDSIEKQMLRVVAPLLIENLKKWQPYIGEKAMNISFLDGIAFPVKVVEFTDSFVKAKGTSGYNSALYSCQLKSKLKDWEAPSALVPITLFEQLKSLFPKLKGNL